MYLADTSLWHRQARPEVADRWEAEVTAGNVATTPPVRLEILYSARSAREYAALDDELDGLVQLRCGEEAFRRALGVQRALAGKGGLHHRSVGLSDLVIAAAAELGGATVWHYDEDFDRIAEVTGQPTEWAVPRGKV